MPDVTTMMLPEFLLARTAEDEAKFGPEPWLDPVGDAEEYAAEAGNRVLAECEAKRRIVGLHTATSDYSDPWDPKCSDEAYLAPLDSCEEMRILAAVYSDHPEYREEWRP